MSRQEYNRAAGSVLRNFGDSPCGPVTSGLNDLSSPLSHGGILDDPASCVRQFEAHLLLNETKLRENKKILEAYENGEFPVEQTVSTRRYNRKTSVVQEPVACTEESRQQPLATPPVSTVTCSSRSTSLATDSQPKCTHDTRQQQVQGCGTVPVLVPVQQQRHVTQQKHDTSNDEAIAVALQEELRRNQSGTTDKMAMQDDYQLALKMQEEFDGEMAQAIQQQSSSAPKSSKPYYNPYAEPFEQVDTTHCGYTKIAPKHRQAIRRPASRLITGQVRPQYERTVSSGYESASGASNDDMSYETMSELEDVSNGLTVTEISRLTSIYRYRKKTEDSESCSICFDEFQQDQQLRCLPCLHKFHRYCIDKWFSNKKTCPVCLKNVS